jgi:hypothetical protein
MRNVNCPKTLVYIRCDAFGGSDDQYEAAWLVSVRAMRNRPLCWQAWVIKYAACYDKIPPHCLYWKIPDSLGKIPDSLGKNTVEGVLITDSGIRITDSELPITDPLPLHKIQLWECLSGSIELWRKEQLADVPVVINLGKGEKPRLGHYWFTLDYLPENQGQGYYDLGDAELLEEHKEANVIKLSNGQVVIYPNNRIKWMPNSLTTEEAVAAIPKWDVASNAQWDAWWGDSEELLGSALWAY